MFTTRARSSHGPHSRTIAPVRDSGPSTTTTTSGSNSGREWTSSAYGSPASDGGTGSAATTSARLPSPSAAIRSASAEPIESASGFSWQISVMRDAPRMASRTASRLIRTLLILDLSEQLEDTVAGLDRVVVPDHELRNVPDRQAAAELSAQPWGGIGQRLERLIALVLAAEDADPDLGRAEVACGLDARDRGEPDARVLHLTLQQLHQLLPDLAVEPIGALAH